MEVNSGMIGASIVPLGDLSGASEFMAARAALFLFSNSIFFSAAFDSEGFGFGVLTF